ncbi:MAG: ABC transporter ATP-binding protein [Spirochaetes bacterium]|nr:MAG: ABC transporter ATP-binding protein [Spirochaetota bacterium]RKX89497.1 MAG: ABC transporter ATP-binding protein [Spirochaetota bacterium]
MSVKLQNISKFFSDPEYPDKGVAAVVDCNLDILEGEMVTLLGPSGCGKTTTLRVISGFESPTSGSVYIDNDDVTSTPPNKRDTSMVFQSYAIFPHLTVAQNIGFGLSLRKKPKNEIEKEVRDIMRMTGLEDMYNRRPDQLSGGQQQRVALARAIINKPRVLLFDEPLSNLDAKLREQMRVEIRRIQKTFGITSIYVTHDQDEAMTVSDRIVVMNEGRVQQVGTPFEIYSRPVNTFVADFIGQANFLDARVLRKSAESVDIMIGTAEKNIKSWSGNPEVGDTVKVVVRPESLRVKKSKDKNDGLNGVISTQVYLGPSVEYQIDQKKKTETFHAVTYNPVESGFFSIGDKVSVDFNSAAAHILAEG